MALTAALRALDGRDADDGVADLADTIDLATAHVREQDRRPFDHRPVRPWSRTCSRKALYLAREGGRVIHRFWLHNKGGELGLAVVNAGP